MTYPCGFVEPSRRPRILFLADRNNLATQAYNDFSAFAAFAEDAMVRIAPGDIRKKGTREERATNAMTIIHSHFNSKQQGFLDFVLSHCVSDGVDELDRSKLTPLLRLKYHDSISDAVADLGEPDEIGKVFVGFQRYLYESGASA